MLRRGTGPAWLLISIAAALGLTARGCGAPAPEERSTIEPLQVYMQVAAVSDLERAMQELADAFLKTTKPKAGISLTFVASGQMATQLKAGAPFDILLAADRKFIDELAAGGLIRQDSVAPYARGTLALAVRRVSRGAIAGLADLKKPEVKQIALANPTLSPYGAAGRQALERAGLWTDVESKIVQAETVHQAYQFVESGNVEAGLVSKANVGGAFAEVGVIEVDPALYDPIIQALGIRTFSNLQDEAKAFSEFIRGPEGQKILARYGFQAP